MTFETLQEGTSWTAVTGTSLKGYVIATRRELEGVFGAPTWATPSDDQKITTEWVIRFSDETIATIYDWKRYEMGAPEMDEVEVWHIGGHEHSVRDKIENALGKTAYAKYPVMGLGGVL